MASVPLPARTLICCGLCLTASVAFGQDASLGVQQQTISTQQTSASSTTSTRQSDAGQIDDAGADQNGSAASGNLGTVTEQTSSSSATRSRSTRAYVGVDLNDDGEWADDHGRSYEHHRGDRSGPATEMIGNWTLGQESGETCTVQLKDNPWLGGYGAYVPAGCPDGFFQASRWLMSGNQLLLTDSNNQVIGRFRPSGGGRWSGRRESDGAHLFLNPAAR